MKSQAVRLADVFFIAPVMALSAVELQKKRPALSLVLFGLAVSTLLYNARNYIEIQKRSAPPGKTKTGRGAG